MTNGKATFNAHALKGFDLLMILLGSILLLYVTLPVANLFIQVDYASLSQVAVRSELQQALGTSLLTASASTAVGALLGIPLAYTLARYNFPGKSLIRILFVIPMVIPPLVGGALLLSVFGPYTLIGSFARSLNVELTQSIAGIVLAQIFVASPFIILTSQSAFEGVDRNFESVSRVLGRSKLRTFMTVTLPLARNGILAGLILTWVRALGEFGATVMMAYNPHTISIQIWEDNAIGGLKVALSGVVFVVILCFATLLVLHFIGRGRILPAMWR